MSLLISSLLNKIEFQLSQLKFSPQKKNSPLCQSLEAESQEAHHYPLNAGGKHIRPLITLLIAGAFSAESGISCALESAIALEMIHTYSLVHDDLPCMDNDDFRRGRLTTHKVYGEAKALLVGDGLLTQAFWQLSQTRWPYANYTHLLVASLAQAAGTQGMILGQWLDLSFTNNNQSTWADVQGIHNYKTGALLGASIELGLICGLATVSQELPKNLIILQEQARTAGTLIGLSFQIIDDILDLTQTSSQLGKTAQKDLNQNKSTSVSLLGLESSKQLADKITLDAIEKLQSLLSEKNINNNLSAPYKEALFDLIYDLLKRTK